MKLSRSLLWLFLALALSGCASPKQLSRHNRYAYWWTFRAHHLTPEQDTKARRLWQNFIEAQELAEWAMNNPPSVTGYYDRTKVWLLMHKVFSADKELYDFMDKL